MNVLGRPMKPEQIAKLLENMAARFRRGELKFLGIMFNPELRQTFAGTNEYGSCYVGYEQTGMVQMHLAYVDVRPRQVDPPKVECCDITEEVDEAARKMFKG